MDLFTPYKKIGAYCDKNPFFLKFNEKTKDYEIICSVGNVFHIYKINGLRLIAVSKPFESPINTIAADYKFIYVASGSDIHIINIHFDFHKTLSLIDKDKQMENKTPIIKHLLPFGTKHLISVDSISTVRVWEIETQTLYFVINFGVAQFAISCLIHPHTYMNKILFGAQQGSLQLWNIKSGECIYTFKGWDNSSVNILQQSTAIDVIGIGLENGRIILHNIKSDVTLFSFHQAWGPVHFLSFRSDDVCHLISASRNDFESKCAIWDLKERSLVTTFYHNNNHNNSKSKTTGKNMQKYMQRCHLKNTKNVNVDYNEHVFQTLNGVAYIPHKPLLITGSDSFTFHGLKCWRFDDNPNNFVGSNDSYGLGLPLLLYVREGHSQPINQIKFYKQKLDSNNATLECENMENSLIISSGYDNTLRIFSWENAGVCKKFKLPDHISQHALEYMRHLSSLLGKKRLNGKNKELKNNKNYTVNSLDIDIDYDNNYFKLFPHTFAFDFATNKRTRWDDIITLHNTLRGPLTWSSLRLTSILNEKCNNRANSSAKNSGESLKHLHFKYTDNEHNNYIPPNRGNVLPLIPNVIINQEKHKTQTVQKNGQNIENDPNYGEICTVCAISPCGNFAFVGYVNGRIDKYNMQSGVYRGSFHLNHMFSPSSYKSTTKSTTIFKHDNNPMMKKSHFNNYYIHAIDQISLLNLPHKSNNFSNNKKSKEGTLCKPLAVMALCIDKLSRYLISAHNGFDNLAELKSNNSRSIFQQPTIRIWSVKHKYLLKTLTLNQASIIPKQKINPILLPNGRKSQSSPVDSSFYWQCFGYDMASDMLALACIITKTQNTLKLKAFSYNIAIVNTTLWSLRLVRFFKQAHTSHITALVFNNYTGNNCPTLMSTSMDKTLKVWDILANQLLHVMQFPEPIVSFDVYGPMLATVTFGQNYIQLWSNTTCYNNNASFSFTNQAKTETVVEKNLIQIRQQNLAPGLFNGGEHSSLHFSDKALNYALSLFYLNVIRRKTQQNSSTFNNGAIIIHHQHQSNNTFYKGNTTANALVINIETKTNNGIVSKINIANFESSDTHSLSNLLQNFYHVSSNENESNTTTIQIKEIINVLIKKLCVQLSPSQIDCEIQWLSPQLQISNSEVSPNLTKFIPLIAFLQLISIPEMPFDLTQTYLGLVIKHHFSDITDTSSPEVLKTVFSETCKTVSEKWKAFEDLSIKSLSLIDSFKGFTI